MGYGLEDFLANWALIVEVVLVSVAIWTAYVIGFVVGFKLGRPHDVERVYAAAIGVILAWLATGGLAIWLAGLDVFVLGVLLFIAVMYSLRV